MCGFPSIFLFSGGAAIVAVLGFLIVHRLVKPIDLDEHQRFLDAMLNIVGTLVSILLGLLVAAALDHYQSLDESIDSEAANVFEIVRLTTGLPAETQKQLRDICVDYSRQVVEDEWPAMAQKGEPSQKVMVTYARMVVTIVKFKPGNEGESNLHQALVSSVQQIGDARRKRLLVLHSNWTSQLMPLLLMCSGIVLAFAYLYMKRGAILHGVLICLVALALGGNLGLVFLLSNPFAGDWKIQPRGFELNNELFKKIAANKEILKTLQISPEKN
jgi:hypothetical protein